MFALDGLFPSCIAPKSSARTPPSLESLWSGRPRTLPAAPDQRRCVVSQRSVPGRGKALQLDFPLAPALWQAGAASAGTADGVRIHINTSAPGRAFDALRALLFVADIRNQVGSRIVNPVDTCRIYAEGADQAGALTLVMGGAACIWDIRHWLDAMEGALTSSGVEPGAVPEHDLEIVLRGLGDEHPLAYLSYHDPGQHELGAAAWTYVNVCGLDEGLADDAWGDQFEGIATRPPLETE
jgi:hypothetical protein